MAYFAKLGVNNKVLQVISVNNNELLDSNGIEQEVNGINFLTVLTNYPLWKQTSYNTHQGIYYNTDPVTGIKTLATDQSKSFRKNFANIGYTYDEDRDAFIPKKLYPSMVLNENKCIWEYIITKPNDTSSYRHEWNESLLIWEQIVI